MNIHEVCERVRAVMLAEFPRGLTIERDYDVSVPDLRGDKEQLIQALLNIVRNAAQALREAGVPGVHLGVSTANPGAIAFYRRLGFTPLEEAPDTVVFGMLL